MISAESMISVKKAMGVTNLLDQILRQHLHHNYFQLTMVETSISLSIADSSIMQTSSTSTNLEKIFLFVGSQ